MSSADRSFVGVVIPVRNRPTSIATAVRSVLAQTCPPDRIIVVDDASSDDTPTVLGQIASANASVRVVTIPHSGPASARNWGLRLLDDEVTERTKAFGELQATDGLVAFLDSDDVWPPDLLHRAHEHFDRHPGVGMVVTDRVETFSASGIARFSAREFDADPWNVLRQQSPRIMSCAVFRRGVLGTDPFAAGRFVAEDSALLIELLGGGMRTSWLPGEPVVAAQLPSGDQERLTSEHRNRRTHAWDRIESAEAYQNAFDRRPMIPEAISGRLLAARWLAALVHSMRAADRAAVRRSLLGAWGCGPVAVLRGVADLLRAFQTTRAASRSKTVTPSQ